MEWLLRALWEGAVWALGALCLRAGGSCLSGACGMAGADRQGQECALNRSD